MELCLLESSDAPIVKGWLHSFLVQHLSWWTQSYKLNWEKHRIETHIKENNLVDNTYEFISTASKSGQNFVRMLKVDSHLSGMIHAEVTTNKFVKFQTGRIQLIWVVPQLRGAGYGKRLIKAAHHWLSEKEIVGGELFVNRNNKAAILLYEKMGYEASDTQMLISNKFLSF